MTSAVSVEIERGRDPLRDLDLRLRVAAADGRLLPFCVLFFDEPLAPIFCVEPALWLGGFPADFLPYLAAVSSRTVQSLYPALALCLALGLWPLADADGGLICCCESCAYCCFCENTTALAARCRMLASGG